MVGADTARRIGQEKYYDNTRAMNSAIDEMTSLGIKFLVFGRSRAADFHTLADLELPPALAELCTEVSEADFRLDLSSTELRRSQEEDD